MRGFACLFRFVLFVTVFCPGTRVFTQRQATLKRVVAFGYAGSAGVHVVQVGHANDVKQPSVGSAQHMAKICEVQRLQLLKASEKR